MKNFFISYNKADKAWAEWIAWTLEEAGYSVVIQAWDFRPGGNFVIDMHEAAAGTERTIAVLSENYLKAEFTHPEWAAAFVGDPRGKQRILIPIRVKECKPEGLLTSTTYIDLIGLSEEAAHKVIMDGLKERGKPDKPPAFPTTSDNENKASEERVISHPVQYPGTSESQASESPNSDTIWNIPTGIQFFTGRREILEQIDEALTTSGTAALKQRQAISGLGGIGKTQTAIEYAKRHRARYKVVLWAVAETRESLLSDFVAIATALNLPERNIQDQSLTVRAVKRWLETNTDWLLILDNADEPVIIEEFIPENSKGHILLTSRAQVFDNIGILNPIELEEMTPGDARDFLLTRTGRDELEPDEATALEELAKELDYLPLALDQAGAYIKELRGSFQDYLTSYKQRGLALLEKGQPTGKYPKSVRTTWSLNFQQVEQTSPAASDLLRVSAFLNPDRIPNELISGGAMELGSELSAALAHVDTDPLALDEVLKPLIQYSLIHRDRKSKTYDIHRLVQVVLRDGMDKDTTRLWVERTVKATARVFPDVDSIDLSQWDSIERLLPHAQACAELIKNNNLELLEAAHLLNLAGRYLHLRGRLQAAESLYSKALTIRETLLGSEHPDVATSLHNQAWLRFNQGKYEEAESLSIRALTIRQEVLGTEHAHVADTLSLLGNLYEEQGRYSASGQALHRALKIREQLLGTDHPDVADSLSDIASLYITQDKNIEAESLLNRALTINEQAFGKEHFKIALILNSLGIIHGRYSRSAEAQACYLLCIAIYERIFGTSYPALAPILTNLAQTYTEQGRYAESEQLIMRSLEIRAAGLGEEHPDIAYSLIKLAYLYKTQNRYTESEELYVRALKILEQSLGLYHPNVGIALLGLANLNSNQRKYIKGEPFARRALVILKNAFGAEHREIMNAMFVLADLLQGLNRKGEAQRLKAQARKLQAKLDKKKSKK
ncbi:MAG TPA: FxSxx-COOH system tetratricopeptide repeat protein [Pyrinomonadaceae bacterium]|nr:FxSxx-COOH system tetratricopeptide repeat protein [Pyrinomonadaceae bacterium]